jgi:mannose-6-phosphate isomerase
VIFLRDSFAHSLGSGLCILEPQEPTDWNILAEWKGYPFGKNDCTLGLDWKTALQAVDYRKMPLNYLNNYVKRTPVVARAKGQAKEYRLVPEEAKKYFMVYRLVVPPGEMMTMPAGRGFYCAVTTGGEGKLVGPFPEVSTRRGVSYFIPTTLPKYAFVCTSKKPLVVICCHPPKA